MERTKAAWNLIQEERQCPRRHSRSWLANRRRSRAPNRPDEGFGAEKESMASLYGPRRQKSPKVSSVEEWRRMGQEGGAVEPTQVDARRGRCAVCASSVE